MTPIKVLLRREEFFPLRKPPRNSDCAPLPERSRIRFLFRSCFDPVGPLRPLRSPLRDALPPPRMSHVKPLAQTIILLVILVSFCKSISPGCAFCANHSSSNDLIWPFPICVHLRQFAVKLRI